MTTPTPSELARQLRIESHVLVGFGAPRECTDKLHAIATELEGMEARLSQELGEAALEIGNLGKDKYGLDFMHTVNVAATVLAPLAAPNDVGQQDESGSNED